MNLIIFPGGGNPESTLYEKVYSVISREANRRGYGEVFSHVRWPGHINSQTYANSPTLTLPSSIEIAVKAINAMPLSPFVILARSYGCVVALEMMSHKIMGIRQPEKILLWGPPPYWLFWQMFVRDIDKNQSIAKNNKGLRIDSTFHATLTPIESLIGSVANHTIVATGTRDPYCTPAFLEYLRSLTEHSNNKYVRFMPAVLDAPHEVTDENGTQVVESYASTLFEN